MRSNNAKVNRMLDAMAVSCVNCTDRFVKEINHVINDERDGYNFDFIKAVYNYRRLIEH